MYILELFGQVFDIESKVANWCVPEIVRLVLRAEIQRLIIFAYQSSFRHAHGCCGWNGISIYTGTNFVQVRE